MRVTVIASNRCIIDNEVNRQLIVGSVFKYQNTLMNIHNEHFFFREIAIGAHNL